MTMDRDTRKIIAATRSLLHRCDQGRCAWLSRLDQPLPPVLDNNWQLATRALRELTDFDPVSGLGDYLDGAAQAGSGPSLSASRKALQRNAGSMRNGPPGNLFAQLFAKPRRAAVSAGAAGALPPTRSKLQSPPGQAQSAAQKGHRPSGAVNATDAANREFELPQLMLASGPGGHLEAAHQAAREAPAEQGSTPRSRGSVAPGQRAESLAARRKLRAQQRFQPAAGKIAPPDQPAAAPAQRKSRGGPAQLDPPARSNPAAARGALAEVATEAERAALFADQAAARTTVAERPSTTTQSSNPVSVDSVAVRVDPAGETLPATEPDAAIPSAARAPTPDELAQQLADAAYLHGVDST